MPKEPRPKRKTKDKVPQQSTRPSRNRSPRRSDRLDRRSSRAPNPTRAPPQPLISYAGTVDPNAVTGPVGRHVHENLSDGWKINKELPMWFIFDAFSPARQFKRGTPYTDDGEFADYGPESLGDLTETDGEPPGWMPYKPATFKRKYHVNCSISLSKFMNWKRGEIRPVKVGVARKRRGKDSHYIEWKNLGIPPPYDRIVCQLIAEDDYAKSFNSHESRRRQAYVNHVLDAFAEELTSWEGTSEDFRSKVLTPILQRQLWGVHDAYSPSVRDAIAEEKDEPTILDATKFYLSQDPVDPELIPNYRRNLLYLPEARWHLGFIMKKHAINEACYNKVRENHDRIMEALREEEDSEDPEDEIPLLSEVEVEVIVDERLEDFFKPELNKVPDLLTEAQLQRAGIAGRAIR
ncbi:hypothetical protein BDM02DRAFT_3194173 [Thelephora ganbajun]|uniref:Uncharacterized protein n=1 Tax=Thelephora ganbajun TaxID=370292 RepID=A0ACB6YWZ6_THEGA|nr:hypothetical protein BDM02DRAFT_3194173 [Thelephora ganbajun]